MSNEVIIITPEVERGSGGLADYTQRVIAEWGDAVSPRLIAPRSAESLAASLASSGGKVLLQYSAYGYDRLGYPRWLLRALIEWKQRSGGVLVVMLHEIWAFWPVLNKNRLIQHLHRRDLRRLLLCADAVFTSTASQAAHLQHLSPRIEVALLPVGSNIRVAHFGEGQREQGVAVLFGLQPSRVRALQMALPHFQQLAARGVVSRLVTIGGGARDPREKELLDRLELRDGTAQHGAAAEHEVSALLSRASFGVSAQDELSATKSGTLMAYAAHGLNVISVNPEPPRFTTTPAELLAGISPAELQARAEGFRHWQEENCSWPGIAEQFARALRLQVGSVTGAT
jgi:glycosyltransferase involved in cell wall biosynthesis